MEIGAIKAQSEAAYGQWAAQWREHAKIHSKFSMKKWDELENSGIGKAILLVGNGWSLEKEIETIKKYKDQVDIICCDKSLGHLIKNGIKPTYCLVADANVNYEKYMQPYENDLDQTTMFVNVCANPKWTHNGNWKEMFFFINKDALNSEVEFQKLSGCENIVVAGTNVSNAMMIVLTQCDNIVGARNFMSYDKYLLIGYDYSWSAEGNYYAFDKTGGGKINYMRHIYLQNLRGDLCFTSNNLMFSAQWLDKYIGTYNLPVVQCSEDSIFLTRYKGVLADQMQYSFKRSDVDFVKESLKKLKEINKERSRLTLQLRAVASSHHNAMLMSVS